MWFVGSPIPSYALMVGILNFRETCALIISFMKGGVGSSGFPESGVNTMGKALMSVNLTPSALRGRSFQVDNLVYVDVFSFVVQGLIMPSTFPILPHKQRSGLEYVFAYYFQALGAHDFQISFFGGSHPY